MMRVLAAVALLGAAAPAALIATAPSAFADKKSEAYVEAKANEVLKVLNDRSISSDARRAKFREYMNLFAHMPSIARRVLGAEGRGLSEADFDKYYKTFETYAMEVYEVHLDQFRGEAIKVTGSKDDDARRSTVNSIIKSSQTGKDTKVFWDVLMSQDGKSYRVRDVGIDLNGSILWLAQDQQAQFESFLGRNNGDVNKLIAKINSMIADMEARKKDGRGSAYKVNGAQ
jgi:phospholipid transport system substrate-binding protein